MKNKLLILFVVFNFCNKLYAQVSTAEVKQKNIQPKIMVIPRVPSGVDMKEFYDKDVNIQIAIAKINEAFLKRGANLTSFDQALKQANENRMLNKASGNESDFKDLVLQNSGSDIYVEAKIDIVKHTVRNANSVNIILDAYQTGTSNILSNKVINGPMFQSDDIGLLTIKAMDEVTEDFLNLMQLKFDDIVLNGQSIFIQFTFSPNAQKNFDTEINNSLVSDLLDEWLGAHAVNGVYNAQGSTSTQAIYNDVRIPLRNPSNPNKNYTGRQFFVEINKFFKGLGLECKREISTNNKLIITIL